MWVLCLVGWLPFVTDDMRTVDMDFLGLIHASVPNLKYEKETLT